MDVLWQFFINFWNELNPVTRVQPWQAGLYILAGRWTKAVGPGVWPCLPLLLRMETLDVVEQIVDLPNQILQTCDNGSLIVSGAIQYRIADIQKYYLKVQDPDESLQALAMLEIASFIGHANSDEVTIQTIEAEAQAMYLTGDNTVGSAFIAG
jgi:regulator of protease activity HflC (stomatin/prohibitin superfamily)